MIALDTSSLISYFRGDSGRDVDAVDHALEQKQAVIVPVVLSELFSDPKLPNKLQVLLRQIPMLEFSNEIWIKAGQLRASVIRRGHKARLADALIAQCCIDARVALITRDLDFKRFREAGLVLVV